MYKKISLLMSMCLLASQSIAGKLHFSVTNNTRSAIIFSSTDWFEQEKHVLWNQTEYEKYYYPPKNIYLKVAGGISAGDYYNSFYVQLDSSCDQLGLPSIPEMKGPYGVVTGEYSPVRYQEGKVHVTIDEAEDSSLLSYHLICRVERSY